MTISPQGPPSTPDPQSGLSTRLMEARGTHESAVPRDTGIYDRSGSVQEQVDIYLSHPRCRGHLHLLVEPEKAN